MAVYERVTLSRVQVFQMVAYEMVKLSPQNQSLTTERLPVLPFKRKLCLVGCSHMHGVLFLKTHQQESNASATTFSDHFLLL